MITVIRHKNTMVEEGVEEDMEAVEQEHLKGTALEVRVCCVCIRFYLSIIWCPL